MNDNSNRWYAMTDTIYGYAWNNVRDINDNGKTGMYLRLIR